MKSYRSARFSAECLFKVSVIGAGNVGATATYAMLLDGTPTHLNLIDVNREKAEGVILDMYHSLPLLSNVELSAGGEMADCSGSNLVIITAGARQNEGETRRDLIQKNKAIFTDIIPKIAKAAPYAILLIVSNPVDVLTQLALELSGFSPERVFGSGTMLDTMRFRYHIAEQAKVGPHSVEAFILGEHGDNSFPLLSAAQIAGVPLLKWPKINQRVVAKSYRDTQQAAYKIINDIGYTCYSIATVITQIMKHIFEDSNEVLPLSVSLDSFYSRKKVALSVPCLLGRRGIVRQVKVDLSKVERSQMDTAIAIMHDLLRK